MAWVGHIWVDLIPGQLFRIKNQCINRRTYSTVSTVCSSALLWCLVDLDVLDNEVSSIKTLGVRIRLCVLQETEEKLGGLDWPSCARDTELLSYCNFSVPASCDFQSSSLD